jgi:hypothetical protein
MFAIARARAKYATPSSAILTHLESNPILAVSVYLFNPVIGVNRGAVGIIKQGATIVHAMTKKVSPEEVVDDPSVGYRQMISFDFDLRAFNFRRPFTIVVANIPVADLKTDPHQGEVNFAIDPANMR